MTPLGPLVAVLVGTDHHPFDRLVSWVADLAGTGQTQWFVQHGVTPLPDGLPGAPLLGPTELQDLMTRADVVVCHGGPGLIMEARAVGHRPIVVARDPDQGEHVDDHQLRFLAFLARRGVVTAAATQDELGRAVDLTLGSRDRLALSGEVGTATSARFGSLVDDLLHRA